ncbi:hypothetical protein D9M68_364610 [compost metagenome]
MNLAGPAGEVAKGVDGALDIHNPRLGDRLAHVDGFDLRQFIGVGFDQVSQAVQQAFPLQGFELAPGAAIELRASGLHGTLQIVRGAHGDAGEHAAGGRLDHLGAVSRLQPGTADEHFLGLAEKALGRLGYTEFLQIVFNLDVHSLFLLTYQRLRARS